MKLKSRLPVDRMIFFGAARNTMWALSRWGESKFIPPVKISFREANITRHREYRFDIIKIKYIFIDFHNVLQQKARFEE